MFVKYKLDAPERVQIQKVRDRANQVVLASLHERVINEETVITSMAGPLVAIVARNLYTNRDTFFPWTGHNVEYFQEQYGRMFPEKYADLNWFEMMGLDSQPNVPHEKEDGTAIPQRELLREKMRETIKDWDALNLILGTLHIDADNPTTVRYVEYNKFTESYRPKSMGLTKFCNMLNRKHEFRFKDTEVQAWSEQWGVLFREPEFIMDWADDAYDVYYEEYFGSCMHGNISTRFYNDQDNVRILTMRDEFTGDLKGRAAVWTNVEQYNEVEKKWEKKNVTVMDRVYPSDGGVVERKFAEYAEERGWIVKEANSFGSGLVGSGRYRVEVDADQGYYPYMDTFSIGKRDPGGRYYLSNWMGDDEWLSQSNSCPWYEEDEDDDYYDDY